MRRHFTATGFVVQGPRTLLHWHKRLQQWLPPGGHIEPDEDPVQAVLREIQEETGATAEVIPSVPTLPLTNPGQLQPPYTILLEDIPESGGIHQHIDLIYFCRLADGSPDPSLGDFYWVDEDTLRSDQPLDLAGGPNAVAVPIAKDVRLLAIKAIQTARDCNRHSEQSEEPRLPAETIRSARGNRPNEER